MRRREFIAGLGSAAAWSVVARAQQRERMRRIGFLYSNFAPSDPEGQARANAFVQGLQEAPRVEPGPPAAGSFLMR